MLPSAHGSPLPGGPDDRTRVVPRADRADRADDRTRFVPAAGRLDVDARTTIVPVVRRPGRMRTVLPWAGFGLVAVVVIAATTAWASTMRGSDGPLLANATPPRAVVSQLPVPAVTAAPVDETTVPAAAIRKPVRPSPAPVAPPKPAPVVGATATVKPTSAAPTTTKAAAVTTTKARGIIGMTPPDQCTPPATAACSAPNQAGSTASRPAP